MYLWDTMWVLDIFALQLIGHPSLAQYLINKHNLRTIWFCLCQFKLEINNNIKLMNITIKLNAVNLNLLILNLLLLCFFLFLSTSDPGEQQTTNNDWYCCLCCCHIAYIIMKLHSEWQGNTVPYKILWLTLGTVGIVQDFSILYYKRSNNNNSNNRYVP